MLPKLKKRMLGGRDTCLLLLLIIYCMNFIAKYRIEYLNIFQYLSLIAISKESKLVIYG